MKRDFGYGARGDIETNKGIMFERCHVLSLQCFDIVLDRLLLPGLFPWSQCIGGRNGLF